MDSTQDLSARVLLRNIISTEPPRSPVTRSWSGVTQGDVETHDGSPGDAESTGVTVRRSLRHKGSPADAEAQGGTLQRSLRSRRTLPGTSRTPDRQPDQLHKLSQGDVETEGPQGYIMRRIFSSRKRPSGTVQTPQEALKMHQKRRLHEGASRSSLAPAGKRLSRLSWPGPMTSQLDDDDITPRRLLQNIIHTEAVVSPVLHVRSEGEGEGTVPPADVSVASSSASMELDLPDLTLQNIADTVKRLRRTRPRPSFNVTAFEKHLETDQDAEVQSEVSGHELSSLSTSLGSATLSLKTPAVHVSTRKAGLRRKTQRQTKFSTEDFIAAVKQRYRSPSHEGEDGANQTLHGTSLAEGFTLGPSDLPDITTDIIHQRTMLYPGASGLSIHETFPPPVGAEQSGHCVEDHPTTEGHTATEDHRSADDQKPIEGHRSSENHEPTAGLPTDVEPGAMETKEEEEESAVMNMEEEEQGHSVNRETQTEIEVPGYEPSSGQPELKLSRSRAHSEGRLPTEHHPEEDYRSAGGHRGGGAVMKDSRSPLGLTFEVDDGSIRSSSVQVEEVQGEEEFQGEKEFHGEVENEEVQEEEEEEVQGEEVQEDEEEEEEMQEEEEVQEEEEEEEEVQGEEGEEEEVQGEEEVHEEVQEEVQGEEEVQEEEEVQGEEGEEEEEEQVQLEEFHEELDDQQEPEEDLSGELSLKTPAFVRKKRLFDLEEGDVAPQQSHEENRATPAKPRKARAKRVRAAGAPSCLPKGYLMSTFKRFAKTRVGTDVYPVLDKIVDAFFERMAVDLETYAHHAKRKTIDVADVELLLRRQGYVSDKVPVAVLIEKYLPMESRKMLIPVATSGNIVIPKLK